MKSSFYKEPTTIKTSTISSEEIARVACAAALDKKALDVVVLDLRKISTFTDFFVICTGESDPQIRAIISGIEDTLREDHSVKASGMDGKPGSQWMVLDFMQVIVHVFHKDLRGFYSLEDLWSDAPRLKLEA